MKNKSDMPPDLIESLVQRLEPVKTLSSVSTSLWTGILLSLLAAFAVLTALAPYRHDLATLVTYPSALIVSTLSLLSLVLLGLGAIRSRMPGLDFQRPLIWGILFLGLQILLLLGWQIFSNQPIEAVSTYLSSGRSCSVAIVCMCIPLMVGFIWFLRRGATLNPGATTWGVLFFAVSTAEFVLPFSCPNEEPMHLILSHFLFPALILGVVLVPLHRFFFKRA